jgi:predicted phage-related endonuclease
VWEGKEIITWRSVTRAYVDAARLRREEPNTYRQYLTESSYRSMRVSARSNKEES